MGYSYDRAGRLACDSCGEVGGVRKRKCPHMVTQVTGGRTYALPYCQPAALCSECYAKERKELHATCREGAARAQAREDLRQAAVGRGEHLLKACFGDWDERVPAGHVLAVFEGGEQRMLTREVYDAHRVQPVPTLESLTWARDVAFVEVTLGLIEELSESLLCG